MRFAGVKPHYYAGPLRIDFHSAHTLEFQQRLAQSAHAFVAIFAFGCDLDRLDDGFISVNWHKRIARLGFVWSRWVHQLLNARGSLFGRKLHA